MPTVGNGVAVYPTAALRRMVEETAFDIRIAPEDRLAELRVLRDEVNSLLGEIDRYMGEAQLERESNAMSKTDRILSARENAEIREELVRRGMADEAELDEMGILSLEEIEELEDAGQLEEAFGLALLRGSAFERRIRRGRGGRFIELPDVPPALQKQGVKRVLRGPDGREHRVYGNRKVSAASLDDNVVRGASGGSHPAMDPRQQRDLKERAHGKKNEPGSRVTRKEMEERGVDPDSQETYESVRAKAYEDRLKALTARIKRAVTGGSARDREVGLPEDMFNASDRVSQQRFLDFSRAAASVPTTTEMHSRLDADGQRIWDDDREQVHDAIIDLFLRKRRRVERDGKVSYELCADCDYMDTQDDPQVLFSGGGYAAGKSSVLDRLAENGELTDPANTLTLDPDQIKALIPEFHATLEGDPEANLVAYEEAWYISQAIQRIAQERRLNVVVDGISNTTPEEMLSRVRTFTDAGYANPRAIYVDIPTEEALSRAANRAKKAKKPSDRRHIPEVVMRAVHRDVAATIPGVINGAAELGLRVEVWDNDQGQAEDGSFRGPKRFVNFDPSEPQTDFVEDRLLWDRLNRKSDESIRGVDDDKPPIAVRVEGLRAEAERRGLDQDPPRRGPVAERVLGDASNTHELHTRVRSDGTRVYSPTRQRTHDAIVDDLMREAKPQEEGRRQFHFVVGGTASGKSRLRDQLEADGELPANRVTIEPDEIKGMLPEYVEMATAGDFYAASATHRESADISDRVLEEATESGMNVVLDITGGGRPPGWFAERAAALKKAGYEVKVHVIDVPAEVAEERALSRALETGRYVPKRRLTESHRQSSEQMQTLLGNTDVAVRFFDNSTGEMRLMAERPEATVAPVVHLPTDWDRYVTKGGSS